MGQAPERLNDDMANDLPQLFRMGIGIHAGAVAPRCASSRSGKPWMCSAVSVDSGRRLTQVGVMGRVRHNVRVRVLCAFLSVSLFAASADAGYDEGVEAFAVGDYAAAMAEWWPLAEAGDANSQYGLGVIFENGHGVGRDYREAAEWYLGAAEQGHTGAQFNLGHLYRLGAGVPPSMDEAVRWWQAAADQGLTQAQVLMGLAYQRGDGVAANAETAVELFTLAADQGYPPGQYALGFAYETGSGVERNIDTARHYYELAAAAGVEQAISRLTSLTFPPTPEEPPPPPAEEDVIDQLAGTANGNQTAHIEDPAAPPRSPAPASGPVYIQPVYIQVAAYVDADRAERAWSDLEKRHPDLLKGLPHRVTSALRDDGSSVFRLQAGPLPISDEAEAICDLLKQQQTDCFIVRD